MKRFFQFPSGDESKGKRKGTLLQAGKADSDSRSEGKGHVHFMLRYVSISPL
jgi:hypothetical protein